MSAFQVRPMRCRRCGTKVTRFERHDVWVDLCVPCGDKAHEEYVAAHTPKKEKKASVKRAKDTPAVKGSHADCTHPRTAAARAECRKARVSA